MTERLDEERREIAGGRAQDALGDRLRGERRTIEDRRYPPQKNERRGRGDATGDPCVVPT